MPEAKKYTDRQLRLRETILNSTSEREALVKAGYSPSSTTGSGAKEILKRAGIAEVFDLVGLTDETLAVKAKELLNAKYKTVTKDGRTVSSPDYPTQLQSLGLVFRVKGHLKEREERAINLAALIQIEVPQGSHNRLTEKTEQDAEAHALFT